MFKPNRHSLCVVAIALLVGGCASLPLQQGRDNVDGLLQAHGVPQVAAQITQWLAEPLTLESAQRIALLRNPRVQAEYARLGISAADAFEAGRLRNPAISLSWLLPLASANGSKVGAAATFAFTDLLLRGARQRIADAQFAGAQEQLAAFTLDVLAQTQRAWFGCVAAQQRVSVRRSVADAAALAADLAQKYNEAGNLGALELAVQRAEASQARIELQGSEMELADARALLQRQLGLQPAQAGWQVPDALPAIPAQAAAVQVAPLQAMALQQRLDLAAARRQVQALQWQRDTVHRYRLVSDVRLGAELEREPDRTKRLGPAASFSLPLFQQGQGAVARADAQLASAQAQLVELESAIQIDVAQQLRRLELARIQAEAYREGLIPQREAVVARLREQANFMLVDSFAVLVARQQEYAAYGGYVDALLRFWTAQVELLRATGSQRGLEESR